MRDNSVRPRSDSGRVFRPIERRRLHERLSAAARYRIITVVAPAGFGKSVALRHFVRRRPRSVLYEISPDSNTLNPFVRGFCDALSRNTPGLRAALPSAFEGYASSSTPGEDLAAWAVAHMREIKTLIVIDNLDTSHDPEISRFLAKLINATKTHIRWCLASRTKLDLPTASWLAYNDSDLGLDANDLLLTVEEARLTAKAAGANLRDDEVDAILRLTEGWPAAFTFAVRNATKAHDLQSAAHGTRDMIYRYIAEQVWHSLEPDVRRFLAIAAFLPWIDARFVTEARIPNCETVIDALRAQLGLLSTRDADAYELHDLFREFISRTVASQGGSALEEAICNAAGILERTGHTAAALDRYVEAEASQSVARLLDLHNMALLESGHHDIAQKALRALKDGPELARSGVLALRAALEEAYGRVDKAEALYERVLTQPARDTAFRVSVSCRYALLLYQQGRTDGIQLLEALTNEGGLSAQDRTHVTGTLAVLLAYAGELERASVFLNEALLLAEVSDEPTYARTHGRAAAVAFFSGDERAVELYANEALSIAERCSLYGVAARVCTSLSTLHTSAGCLPLARSHAERVVRNAERAGDPEMRARGLRELIALDTEQGNEDLVSSAERDLASFAYAGPNGLPALLLARAIRSIWHARFDEATKLLRDAEKLPFSVHQNRLRTSLLAIASAASGDTAATLSALSAYEAAVQLDSNTHSMFARSRALSLRYAILAAVMISKRDVLRRLERELIRGEKTNFFDAFDVAIESVKLRSAVRLATALQALRSCSQGGISRMISVTTAPLFPFEPSERIPLTATETAVLRSLVQGLSNQAIASSHNRTINTVRTHVSSILRKLGCQSRGEAVATARRLRLI